MTLQLIMTSMNFVAIGWMIYKINKLQQEERIKHQEHADFLKQLEERVNKDHEDHIHTLSKLYKEFTE